MADEIGLKTNTYHTHAYLYMLSRVRVSTVQKHFPGAHIELVKGSVKDNIDYLTKSGKWENDKKHETSVDGTFEEYGTRPKDSKGKHNEMTELYQMILEGMSNAEIIAYNQDYILQLDKIDKLRFVLLQEEYKNKRRTDLEVTYIYGTTGSGKTRSVLDEYGDSNVYRVTDYQHPFDGYNCQEVILFDEFRSSLPLKDMLNYCDIYPLELPSRYNNKFACYNKVFIISNWELEQQYSELQRNDTESWNAFLRRIHQVTVFNSKDNITTYESTDKYFKRDTDWQPITEDIQLILPFKD